MLWPAGGTDHRRRRGRCASPVVRAAEVRPQARDVELTPGVAQWLIRAPRDVEAVGVGAVRARTLKGPIQRGEGSDHAGTGVCSVSASTSSPAVNRASRQ